MKILHIGPVKPGRAATGPSHSIRGLAIAQAGNGLEVALLSTVSSSSGAKMKEIPGIYVFESPKNRHYNPWFISQNWIVRILEEFGTPDVVNFHSVYDPFQIALARRCRQLGWPYIVTPRGGMTKVAQNIKSTKKKIANVLCFRSYAKQAEAVHALTTSEADEIRKLFNVKSMFVVPNGVDEMLLSRNKNLKAASLGEFADRAELVLAFIGRIDVHIKGLDLLLKALAKLRSDPDAPTCKLFMVGPFFTERDKRCILSTIQELGLEDEVKLFGPKFGEEEWSYFLACDVYIQTSRSEGMPMSVVEAMALGRPCLVTSGTRVGPMVREGGGWECQLNPASIAETIKSIYHQKDSLKILGRQSCKLIQSRFTWRRIAQQLNEEYLKIIKPR